MMQLAFCMSPAAKKSPSLLLTERVKLRLLSVYARPATLSRLVGPFLLALSVGGRHDFSAGQETGAAPCDTLACTAPKVAIVHPPELRPCSHQPHQRSPYVTLHRGLTTCNRASLDQLAAVLPARKPPLQK